MNNAPAKQSRPLPLMIVILWLAATVWLSILQYANVHFATWLRLPRNPRLYSLIPTLVQAVL